MMHKGQATQAYIYIRELVAATPNDKELGKKIRKHVNILNKQ